MSAVPSHAPRPAPATARAARPAARPTRAPAAPPRLRLVRAPVHTRTRVPFVSLCMGILGIALLASLLLNTTMAQASYRQHELTIELTGLTRSIQESQTALEFAASPKQLARAAKKLGMVPAPDIAFLSLEKGKVLGNPTAAESPQSEAAEAGQ